MATFDLILQPWIPCALRTGEHVEYGLREVFAHATDIHEIEDGSPLVTVALHRLLLTILHRNFGPRTLKVWRDLWNRSEWDMTILDAYFARYKDRFDLFHALYPFMQVPEMPDATKSPISRIIFEHATGNNATLFDHTFDSSVVAVAPAVAARHLLTYQLYPASGTAGGGLSFYDAPLARGRTVLSFAEDLFHTFCLNMVIYNESVPIPHDGDDAPSWERDVPTDEPEDGGYLDYLTTQARRLHLMPPGNDKQVQFCQVKQNRIVQGGHILDPFIGYRRDPERGWVPIQFDRQRTTWRDSSTLFTPSSDTISRPQCFAFLKRVNTLRADGEIVADTTYRFAALGVGRPSGKENIYMWRHERLPLPLAYLDDAPLRRALDGALALAERAGSALQSASKAYLDEALPSLRGEKLDRKKKRQATLANMQRFWATLETPFTRYLESQAHEHAAALAAGVSDRDAVPIDAAMHIWAREVKHAAAVALGAMLGSLDHSAKVIRARVIAEGVFYKLIGRAMTQAGFRKEDANDG